MEREQIQDMIADPFYCLPEVYMPYTLTHDPLITEEVWIGSGVKLINEIGAEAYLKSLLRNLKGEGSHWVANSSEPEGYKKKLGRKIK